MGDILDFVGGGGVGGAVEQAEGCICVDVRVGYVSGEGDGLGEASGPGAGVAADVGLDQPSSAGGSAEEELCGGGGGDGGGGDGGPDEEVTALDTVFLGFLGGFLFLEELGEGERFSFRFGLFLQVVVRHLFPCGPDAPCLAQRGVYSSGLNLRGRFFCGSAAWGGAGRRCQVFAAWPGVGLMKTWLGLMFLRLRTGRRMATPAAMAVALDMTSISLMMV